MLNKRAGMLVLSAWILVSCLVVVQGQNITGGITGVAKDVTGGVVPGVSVTAVHLGTNAEFTTVTGDMGSYTIRTLPIGIYNLSAEMPGFKKFEATDIRVQINEIVRQDIVLQVGEVSESITVTGATVAVDATSGTLKTVIDQRRVEDLPLNGRNPTQLMRLVAGVGVYAGSGVTSGTTYPGVTPVSVNGSRGNATNYILDGGNNNDHYSNAPNPMPNPDALAEFSVQTNNFSAEFGRNAGGVVNAVTKSGTNELHGSAFWYIRHHSLNAANFFAPYEEDDPTKKVGDGLKRNQFGATIGGPLWLGSLYDGRDRTFWFFSYQGTLLRRTPTTRFVNVFTEAERNGDFSETTTKQLVSPFTGEPYPNNQIPESDWSPVSKYILDNLIPIPTDGRQISFTTVQNNDDNQILVKGDHNITDNNLLTGRYFRSWASQPGFLDQKNIYNTVTQREWKNWSVVVTDTHTFGATLVNNALFSFNRTEGPSIQIYPEKNYNDLGIQGIHQDCCPQYYFSIQGVSGINTGDTNNFIRDEWQANNTVRWTKGRHQLSFGGEGGKGLGDIVNNYYANGRFYFRDSANWTGNAMADFLVGKFSEFRQGIGEFKETRFDTFSLFIHDSFKVTNRFTLDMGLRWEPYFPYWDKLGKLAVWRPGEKSQRFINAPTNILYPGDPDVPPGGYETLWNNFAPRLGIAYALTEDGKTSIRAGYGIFYDHPNTISTNSAANQGPFGTRINYYGNEYNSFSDPWGGFPGGNPMPVTGFDAVDTDVLNPPSDAAFFPTHVAFVYERNMRNAYMQSWNLTLEREFAKDFVGRISYAGSKGTALVSGRDVNAPLPDPNADTGSTNERRPLYPDFGRVTLIEGVGNSSYNAMQLTVEKRFSRGYSIMANYTWSHAIDNNQGSANKGTGISVTNPLDLSLDRGTADFDRTHVFNFSGLWELPFHFDNGAAEAFLGGWNTTAIITIYSGDPFYIQSGVDNARTGQGGQRADLVGNPDRGDQTRGEKIEEYLNKDAFAPNALGTYGTLGRNVFRDEGFTSVDLGIHKRFAIAESTYAEFRFEMFNAFNNVNLGGPTTNMTSRNFMRITSAADPRILQFALRFVF